MNILFVIAAFIVFVVLMFVCIVITFFIFIPFIATLGIFIPAKFIWSKEHLESCKLIHKGWSSGFWHFVDTRANTLALDHWGARPPKNSINRSNWLKHQISFLNENIPGSYYWGQDYMDYCGNLREEYTNELNNKIKYDTSTTKESI